MSEHLQSSSFNRSLEAKGLFDVVYSSTFFNLRTCETRFKKKKV